VLSGIPPKRSLQSAENLELLIRRAIHEEAAMTNPDQDVNNTKT